MAAVAVAPRGVGRAKEVVDRVRVGSGARRVGQGRHGGRECGGARLVAANNDLSLEVDRAVSGGGSPGAEDGADGGRHGAAENELHSKAGDVRGCGLAGYCVGGHCDGAWWKGGRVFIQGARDSNQLRDPGGLPVASVCAHRLE